ncbi:hypothetical protein EPN52_09120 [bacterium]|nr:MAG: hypothetical protein EPN52_09120 [bacterium]
MFAMALAAALGMGAAPLIEHGDGCDPLPAVAAQSLSFDPRESVVSLTVPLLTPPLRVIVSGPGLRRHSAPLRATPAPGSLRAVNGGEERRGAVLPPLLPGGRYDVRVGYMEPTPEGCLPPPPALVGSFLAQVSGK